MKGYIWAIIAAAAVIVLLGVFVAGSYNHIVGLDQDVNAKWSEVENQYQRQADLIPNLVSTVASSVRAETTFVQDVISARNNWQNAQNEVDKDAAGVAMTDSVATFVNAIAEAYPEFKANAQYVALTDELSGTQNRIGVARGRYIQSVQTYNTAVKRFPSNIFAGMFGYGQREYYHASEGALTTPSLGTGELP